VVGVIECEYVGVVEHVLDLVEVCVWVGVRVTVGVMEGEMVED
jgi:hypothetical protein